MGKSLPVPCGEPAEQSHDNERLQRHVQIRARYEGLKNELLTYILIQIEVNILEPSHDENMTVNILSVHFPEYASFI